VGAVGIEVRKDALRGRACAAGDNGLFLLHNQP
jgi:hypothetical protein